MMDKRINTLENNLVGLQQIYLKLSYGKSQCVLGKEGQPSIEIKQAEGAMQAMSDLIRCLKKHTDDASFELCVVSVKEQWQKLSEISPQWAAYKQAGLEELEKV